MENIVLEERNDMRGRYLVAVGCEEGGYKEEMLKNSRIPGLLAVTGQDFNGRHELWYETTARQALKLKFSQRAPGVEEITKLMRQIGGLAQKLEEYLLQPEEIVTELSCIFEGEEGEILFLYVPGYKKENPSGICRLLEELMEYVDYEDHRAVSFLYLLHARSRQQAGGIFSLHRLCEEILGAAQAEEERRREDDLFGEFEETQTAVEEKNKVSWKDRAAERWKSGGAEPESKMSCGGRSVGEKAGTDGILEKGKISGGFHGLLRKIKRYIKANAGENDGINEMPEKSEVFAEACEDTVLLVPEELSQTVLLTGDPDTVLLQEQEYYVLEPVGKGREDIPLKTFPFFIGKEEMGGGYALKDAVISRRHAKILKEGMRYFLVDTKSLNGTYLNGERLAADERKELKDGDQIDFADIGFIFACRKAINGI